MIEVYKPCCFGCDDADCDDCPDDCMELGKENSSEE